MVPVMEKEGEQWRLCFYLPAFVLCSTEKWKELNIGRLLIVPNHVAAQLTIHVAMLLQEPIVVVYDTRFRGKNPKRTSVSFPEK